MASTRRLSLGDFNESFEDLDNSLDEALNNASNKLFNYTQSHNNSRNNSQGSVGAIPLSNMSPEMRHSRNISMDRIDDNLPLMGGPSYGGRHSYSSSTSSFQTAARQVKQQSGRLGRKFADIFRGKKRSIFLDGESGAEERPSIEPLEASTNIQSEEDRFITPRGHGPRGNEKSLSNGISNAKYNAFTFIPVILYEQFKFFFNLYFLLVALSQIIPQLRIGYLSSYIVPLTFVLTVTMMKEAGDDIARRRRDKEQNNELYEVLNRSPLSMSYDPRLIASKDLKVGDIVRLHKNTRIPADMILLQTSDNTGEAFIKTDQLDGETDWKLRIASNVTQVIEDLDQLINSFSLIVSKPTKSIHSFMGKLVYSPSQFADSSTYNIPKETFPLSIDQTLWTNTVLASGTALGIIIYTGVETRQQMNSTKSGVKVGLLEFEINSLSKILCIVVFVLSLTLVICNGWPLKSTWYIDVLRFLILFSTIIPVSLRVNLDLAKSVYASQIQNDREIPNTIVRTSTIPEDLGRIEYLLSDKTGTLTQNDMELKKLHLGMVSYAGDSLDIVADYITNLISLMESAAHQKGNSYSKKRDLNGRVCDLVLTLAICHNVTPTYEDEEDKTKVSYQAASPDEIALVQFTESVGLKLHKRDRHSLSLMHMATNQVLEFKILYMFPFSSDTKRMGIIVKDVSRNEVWFMQKGADTVMTSIVNSNDWLDEETSNMAREGLRTLVVGRKRLTASILKEFEAKYQEASLSLHDRDAAVQRVISYYLERDLELQGLTGVEDKLQKDVKTSIELLRNAGVKIWMLTGDKVETAKCVAINAKIISRGQYIHQITKAHSAEYALSHLEVLRSNRNSCLLIDGESLALFTKYHREEFFEIVLQLPAVIACRCSPQQKADVALAIREITGKRVCCIGDGGNDVSMIQCADVGVGIVGKEGKQASLAADFSVDQFCYLLKLLLWHGRNSYKRSAKLAQFVIHRGLLISVAQAIYSIASKFEPLALYQGWLMVGYSTVYTMAPVFSLTLDCDIQEKLTRVYPELYRELTLGRSLSYRTFFMWVFISLFQGSVIQLFSQGFHSLAPTAFTTMVALSFSALVYNELIMVALQINKWNRTMSATLIVTFLIYVGSIPLLGEYFNLAYVTSLSYLWQTVVILAVALFPVWAAQAINRRLRPPSYAKVQQD
ncbi:Piso0_003756 [Millerozyma farinosa CBS 7064]|uniref:Phospholipid-transporting ATPase n=1 Tax=Pichia sorbitophila (strain ATCC MYA-4447 / BCRC 22081 / CBS 7064 / NBRC 10061 / NRRL Y-12695) TaxID=559304 RepID=G8Y6I5_PICSO|nr:Piso0_003756 [Millerozyma farinosa CBS 7064]CCE84215.1 Piso0_003756 [Millerozyma farinosa CBS 7064]